MGKASHLRKEELLGTSYGKASAILRKTLLFQLVVEAGRDTCFQCGQSIETEQDLSIEHKQSWQLANNPQEMFFDLTNIAFSHLSCNIKAADRTHLKRSQEINKQKIQCPQGHSYEDHGYIHSDGSRSCKVCRRDGMRKFRETLDKSIKD